MAADTVLGITSDKVIGNGEEEEGGDVGLMFPYIQGVLAFDTPYLGISPGVVAHGAEEHYNTASSAYTQLSGLTGAIWGGKAAADGENTSKKKPVAALPAPPAADASVPAWQKWGKIAAMAGAGAVVAAGSAALYSKRETITQGWSWVGSHLEFVGCLMKGEELRKRIGGVVKLNKEMGVGFGNLYTRLGHRAVSKSDGKTMVGSVIGNTRTFCNLPKKEGLAYWHEAVNDAAGDEAGAHMSMSFFPSSSFLYFKMEFSDKYGS